MPSVRIKSLADRALSGLSQEQAPSVAAELDKELSDQQISAGDRGALLVARAIAGQLFEGPGPSYERMSEAIPLLAEADEHDEQLAALAAAASFALQLGDFGRCMELAVQALTLMGSGQVQNVSTNVPANLSVLFSEFSAFDMAYDLSVVALNSLGGKATDAIGVLVSFGLARTIIEAAWFAEPHDDIEARLQVAEDTAQAVLVGQDRGESSSGPSRTLVAGLILSEVELLRGNVNKASEHIETALANPEGSLRTLEGYANLVAGMVARRQGRNREALALFDVAEGPISVTLHRLDRLRAERAAARAALGDFEGAYREATLRADTAGHHRVRFMGAIIDQILARADAEQSRQTLVETTETLTEENRRDALTGVAARRWFDTCLKARATNGGDVALVLLDIDNFKLINDECSHLVGDAVLRRMGELLLNACAEGDLAARYGGDEFVILPESGELWAAEDLAQQVRKAIEAEPWSELHPQLDVTVSAGVSAGPSTRALDTLSAADAALYGAKDMGRNCVVARRLATRSTDH